MKLVFNCFLELLEEDTIIDPRYKGKVKNDDVWEGLKKAAVREVSNHQNVSSLRMRAMFITRCIFILNVIIYRAAQIRQSPSQMSEKDDEVTLQAAEDEEDEEEDEG